MSPERKQPRSRRQKHYRNQEREDKKIIQANRTHREVTTIRIPTPPEVILHPNIETPVITVSPVQNYFAEGPEPEIPDGNRTNFTDKQIDIFIRHAVTNTGPVRDTFKTRYPLRLEIHEIPLPKRQRR